MYHLIGHTNESLVYYLKALELCPSENYYQVAYSSVGMGNIYFHEFFNNEQALESYQKALEMKLKYLDETNTEIIDLYDTIGGSLEYILFKQTGEIVHHRNASINLEQAVKISANYSLQEDPQFILVFRMLGDLNYHTNNDLTALNYYQKGIDCENRAQRPFDEFCMKEIPDLYLYAGLLYHRLDNIDLAFQCWNKVSQYISDCSIYSNIYQKLQMVFDEASHLHALKYKKQVTFF
ncbi:unnamed protein product [Rotaria sp. Silwood2]|nr:unnamed protein product [Rotaria sp. Silwood2]CAF2755647.1 unnamed protein product [Rotaria sp. Silwood2]CAF3171438.1 unnamed protein product [Rotaria sp. Silwood2]CAF4296368.1 unnamed protein product [Rotaria sp. Silwood2]CAF4299134.1 unnamed protein product [Rotaria sp. Silwood2]